MRAASEQAIGEKWSSTDAPSPFIICTGKYINQRGCARCSILSGTQINRRRGRPRQYDAAKARTRLRDAFWRNGNAATSLEDLVAATGMNRPSLYAAFGDKQAMYAAAIDDYVVSMRTQVGTALALPTLREALGEFYRRAIALYLSGDQGPRGCMVVCVALVEAPMHTEVGARVKATLAETDAALERRIEGARRAGEVRASGSSAELAQLAAATLHSIAVRARAGASRAALARQASATVDLICGGSR